MTPDQIENVQYAARIVGRYERRGNEAVMRVIMTDNGVDESLRLQRATDALMLYGAVVARRLGQLRDIAAVEVLDAIESLDTGVIPAPLQWQAATDLMKLLAGGTELGAASKLTADGALATGFNLSVALTRELATEEGKRAKEVADNVSASIEHWAADWNLFDKEAAMAATVAGALDPAGRELRRAIGRLLVERCHTTAGRLLVMSNTLTQPDQTAPSPFGHNDDRVAALGYLCLSISSLGAAIMDLTERNPYAASALMRQLVEVEFLLWAFSENEEEASRWLRSSKTERDSQFSARHFYRKAANGFRGKDYGMHCDIGGHPTPVGLQILVSGGEPTVIEGNFGELINHGGSAWIYLVAAAAKIAEGYGIALDSLVEDAVDAEVRAAVGEWRSKDPLRLQVQIFADTVNL